MKKSTKVILSTIIISPLIWFMATFITSLSIGTDPIGALMDGILYIIYPVSGFVFEGMANNSGNHAIFVKSIIILVVLAIIWVAIPCVVYTAAKKLIKEKEDKTDRRDNIG